jgi:hypothetical protein
MGGSTAYGWGAADDETIAALVESRLRANGQPNASVINAGYPGLTTLDTLLVYHERIAPLHPSTVIVLAGLNDLYYAVDWLPSRRLNWANRTYELGLRARHDPQLRPLVDAINRIALRNCFTCYAVGNGLSRLYDRTLLGPAQSLSQALGQEPIGTSNPRAMQLTAWGIGELARRVRADGGCLVVAWQPIAGIPVGPRSRGSRTLSIRWRATLRPGRLSRRRCSPSYATTPAPCSSPAWRVRSISLTRSPASENASTWMTASTIRRAGTG